MTIVRQFGILIFREGEKIFHEGEPNTNLYGILSGYISIWVGTGLPRRPQQLTSLATGQLFSEYSY